MADADRGFGVLAAIVASLPASTQRQGLRAMNTEAQVELTEAKRQTPVDLGVLRASGKKQTGHHAPDEVVVQIGFGGDASSEYAVQVHEDLDAFHRVGNAKFLEAPLRASGPFLPGRIARRIERALEAEARKRLGV